MALFPQVNTYFMGRTNTSLVVSEGNAPAEKYIPSANEEVKFQYHFGPEGNQNVVIPKGKAVAIAGMEWDIETEHYVPALRVANGALDENDLIIAPAIGINHHNVYERIRDRFSGNQPTVITREYIELPLFPSKSYAKAIEFGAAWVEIGGDSPKPIDYANAIIGKKIAVDEYGNLTVATQTYKDVIGTCYGVETDVPPAGYLQYFMEMDDQRWAEFVKQMSYAPSMGRTKDADWNDIGTYPLGTGYLKSKEDLMKNFRAGIPFLTDGYFRARTEETYTLDTTGVDVKIAGHITIAKDTEDSNKKKITCSDYVGAALFIRLPDKLAMDAMKTGMDAGPEFANGPQPGAFSVKIGNTTVSEANYHIDYTNNMVVIYLTQAVENQPIEIKAVVLKEQIPGIPTGWDFKYALGGVRILLQR